MIPDETKPISQGRVGPIEVPGWKEYASLAKDARDNYESHLTAIMQQHGISTEAELFTGVISNHSRFNSMKQDKENAEIVIGKQCEHLLEATRKRFEEDVKTQVARADPEDDEGALMIKRRLASAWFMLVYGESEDAERNFFSFPWSIASVLAATLKWLRSEFPAFFDGVWMILRFHFSRGTLANILNISLVSPLIVLDFQPNEIIRVPPSSAMYFSVRSRRTLNWVATR